MKEWTQKALDRMEQIHRGLQEEYGEKRCTMHLTITGSGSSETVSASFWVSKEDPPERPPFPPGG